MTKLTAAVVATAFAVSGAAGPAFAQAKPSRVQNQQKAAMAGIPKCSKNLGTISLADGDDPSGWTQHNLAAPQKLLRVMVQRSGCFSLVDRGTGLNAALAERNLASGGQLQNRSNVGQGQMKAADYVLVAEVGSADSNAGGSALAGIAGGLIGGRAGALVGGIRTKKLEANTVLSITNVRTTETVAVTEGHAVKNDIGFAVGGGWGFAGAVGGGYEDTEIGRIVTLAFINAYTDLVTQLGGLEPGAAQQAPQRAFQVSTATTLRQVADAKGGIVRALPVGLKLYPTGNKNGLWWEVMDENENTGWVQNDKLAPAN